MGQTQDPERFVDLGVEHPVMQPLPVEDGVPTSLPVRDIALHPGIYDGPTVGDANVARVNSKAEKIVQECQATGEPCFAFRAKDILAIFPLTEYFRVVELYGGPVGMQEGVARGLEEFKAWQRAHPHEIRFPD